MATFVDTLLELEQLGDLGQRVLSRTNIALLPEEKRAFVRDRHGRFSETGGGSGSYDPPTPHTVGREDYLYTGFFTEENVASMLANYAEGHKVSVEEYKTRLEAGMKQVVAEAVPTIRCPQAVLKKVVAEEDGRFKSTFESKKTGAAGAKGGHLRQYQDVRNSAEKDMFDYDTEGTDPKERPIYGYFTKDRTFGNPAGAPRHYDPLEQYGDCSVQLRDGIKGRATVSFGDTLDNRVAPSPATDPKWYSWHPIRPVPEGGMPSWESRPYLPSYVEAQFHGGVRRSDVEHVIFHRQPKPDLTALLDKAGIGYHIAEEG